VSAMKIYILDDNGRVVFEFSETGGGFALSVSQEVKVKIAALVNAALKFLRAK